jgi:hypothetical protein
MTELAYSRKAETTSEFGGGIQAIRDCTVIETRAWRE